MADETDAPGPGSPIVREARKLVSLERAHELLISNPDTGQFHWKKSRGRVSAGTLAGTPYGIRRQYLGIGIDGRIYYAHRLAWFLTHGCWPAADIDHINGEYADNRLVNLREATTSQNIANSRRKRTNTSGHKGVYRARGAWVAQIRVQRRKLHLGCFPTAELAGRAYQEAAAVHFGEFARA